MQSLPEVVQADVTRTINRNGYNWMVTFSSFDTVDVSYEMKVNTAFGAAISGDVTVKSVNTYVIDTDSGVPTFATVAAKNSYGEGYSTTSDPASKQASTQVPSTPEMFDYLLLVNTMNIQFNAALNGGDVISITLFNGIILLCSTVVAIRSL